MTLTLDDLTRARWVQAKRPIPDSPLSPADSPASMGSIGEVCDVDHCNGVVFVDFGAGAIACVAEELRVLA